MPNNKRFSDFVFRPTVLATDLLVGLRPTEAQESNRNVKWSPDALATYVNPKLNAIRTHHFIQGTYNKEPDGVVQKAGYVLHEFLTPDSSGVIALHYYTENDVEKREFLYTHNFSGNVNTTPWLKLTGTATRFRFNAESLEGYLAGDVIVFSNGGQDRLYTAKQDMQRGSFPGGLIPEPSSGDDDDLYWEQIAAENDAVPTYQTVSLQLARQLVLEQELAPRNSYYVQRPNKPTVLLEAADGNVFDTDAQQLNSTTGLWEHGAYDIVADTFTVGASGGGGGGGTFPADFLVVSAPYGKYNIGQTVPAAGKSVVDVTLDAFSGVLRPTYSPAEIYVSQSVPTDGEIGESVSPDVTGTFQKNDAGALSSLRVYRVNSGTPTQLGAQSTTTPVTRSTTVVRTATPIGFYAVADYAQGARKNNVGTTTPDDRPYAVRSGNAPQAAEIGFQSAVVYLNGYYKIFYGTGSATTSVQVRTLAGSQLTSQGNSFILNTGTSATVFTFWLPAGKTVQNVTDLDNLNANITGAYVASALSVADASGYNQDGTPKNPVAGTRYTLTAQAPYSANARHQVTIS